MPKRTRVAATTAITTTPKAKKDLLHCGNVTVKKPKGDKKKKTSFISTSTTTSSSLCIMENTTTTDNEGSSSSRLPPGSSSKQSSTSPPPFGFLEDSPLLENIQEISSKSKIQDLQSIQLIVVPYDSHDKTGDEQYANSGHLVSMKQLRNLAKFLHMKKYGSMRKQKLFGTVRDRVIQKHKMAVRVIELWWRKQSIRRNAICPISLMKIPMNRNVFSLVEEGGQVFFFSPNDLACYMMESLQFVNPCTRRELLPTEIRRLERSVQFSDEVATTGLFSLYSNREAKRAEKKALGNDFLVLENILEETVEFVLEEGMNIATEGNVEMDVNNMAWFVGINTLQIVSGCITAIRHQYLLQKSKYHKEDYDDEGGRERNGGAAAVVDFLCLSPSEFMDYLCVLKGRILHMIEGSPVVPNRFFIHEKILIPFYEGTRCLFDAAISQQQQTICPAAI